MGAGWVEGHGRCHMRSYDPELVDGLDYILLKNALLWRLYRWKGIV